MLSALVRTLCSTVYGIQYQWISLFKIDEKLVIDKLDGSNWSTWKFQIRHLLLAEGLWSHVSCGWHCHFARSSDVVLEDRFVKSFASTVLSLALALLGLGFCAVLGSTTRYF